ncbi:rubredoxin [Mycolicibacterium brumae]|uniref:rubredoxin n=1 Tax=Mycolicibacterium brumae TaxID=85968 RepID=UPI0027B96BDC|nr:rubredoxin [Mycolicibacterium brumae]
MPDVEPQAAPPVNLLDTVAKHRCPICRYVYDQAVGAPAEGFPAGTAWADIPDNWCCPDCGVREKIDFEPVR